jgi:hypothetical protein
MSLQTPVYSNQPTHATTQHVLNTGWPPAGKPSTGQDTNHRRSNRPKLAPPKNQHTSLSLSPSDATGTGMPQRKKKHTWFWSMQVRNLKTWSPQTFGSSYCDAWAEACGAASTGADDPPPKKPPMAWPMEDPTATPLQKGRRNRKSQPCKCEKDIRFSPNPICSVSSGTGAQSSPSKKTDHNPPPLPLACHATNLPSTPPNSFSLPTTCGNVSQSNDGWMDSMDPLPNKTR